MFADLQNRFRKASSSNFVLEQIAKLNIFERKHFRSENPDRSLLGCSDNTLWLVLGYQLCLNSPIFRGAIRMLQQDAVLTSCYRYGFGEPLPTVRISWANLYMPTMQVVTLAVESGTEGRIECV